MKSLIILSSILITFAVSIFPVYGDFSTDDTVWHTLKIATTEEVFLFQNQKKKLKSGLIFFQDGAGNIFENFIL